MFVSFSVLQSPISMHAFCLAPSLAALSLTSRASREISLKAWVQLKCCASIRSGTAEFRWHPLPLGRRS